MTIDINAINIWAVLVATVVAFLIGGVWYGAIFGNAWVRLSGHSEEAVAAMAKSQLRTFSVFLLMESIMSLVLAALVQNLALSSVVDGLLLGALLWLGVALVFGVMRHAANRKSVPLIALDSGHDLLVLLAASTIITTWQ